MKNKLIYLGGKMTGLSVKEYSEWREKIQDRFYMMDEHYRCFNPAKHFSFEDVEKGIITDKQAMDIDLYKLRRSDLMVVDFRHGSDSLGTMAEIGIAYDHQIPILGICENVQNLHPWIVSMCNKFFENEYDLVFYAAEHYLNEVY